MFLKHLVLSTHPSRFQNKKVTGKIIKKILKKTKGLKWDFFEDHEPIRNSKKNIFGLDGQIFNFLPGSMEIPENFLERVATRYFAFEDKIKKHCGYSIKKEFVKILDYQTSVIDFIEENRSLRHGSGKFVIPSEEFVAKWMYILQKRPQFSRKLWSYGRRDTREPIKISDSEKFFLLNPIVEARVYAPYILLHSFDRKVINDLKDILNDKIKQDIRKQLSSGVYESLAEIIPREAILFDYNINRIKDKIDFGFVFDNKFFIFLIIEETFDCELYNKKIKEKLLGLKDISSELKKEKISVKLAGEQKLDGPIDPIIFVIIDDLDSLGAKYVGTDYLPCKNTFIVTPSCLRHVFEDIADNKRTPIYLSKIVDKYHSIQKVISFSFCDFYDIVSNLGSNSLADVSYGKNLLLAGPHTWSYEQRKIIAEKRPKIDLRPPDYELPYTFKVIKHSENLFYGYNRLLNHDFCCYKNEEFEIYIISDRDKFGKEELKLIEFLYGFLGISFEKLFAGIPKKTLKKKKIIFDIIPRYWALEKGISAKSPLGIISNRERDKFACIIDSSFFFEIFNEQSQRLLEFFVENFIKHIVGKTQFKKIRENLEVFETSRSFKITKVATITNLDNQLLCYPTEIDFADMEVELANHFRGKVKSGIYSRDEAKKIANTIYGFLLSKLEEKIGKYELLNFVNFCYSEIESCMKESRESHISFRQSQEMETDYNALDEVRKTEYKLQQYSPTCRFLLEYAIHLDVTGKQKISITDWQSICSIAMNLLSISNISDYLHFVPDLIDIKISINFEKEVMFDVRIEENPINYYIESYINGLKAIDTSAYLFNDSENIGVDPFDKLRTSFEERSIKKVDDEIEGVFGFRLIDYIQVMEGILALSMKKEATRGVVKLPFRDLVDSLNKKTSLCKEVIRKVIDFSTIYSERDTDIIKPWKVSSRKNRLLIKPLVKISDAIIVGPEMVAIADNAVIQHIIEGKWPYNRDLIPQRLDKALRSRANKVSSEFEKSVYTEVEKYVDFCEVNLCTKNKNDKCLVNINEPCPGEIDVLSIQSAKKTLILWEAKDMPAKFGSREIVSDLQDFTRDGGYIQKIKNKEDFLRNNIESILDYYKIDDKANWEVISCFVLSENSPVKNILARKYNIITFSDIKNFIEK